MARRVAALALGLALAAAAPAAARTEQAPEPAFPAVTWHDSRPLGLWYSGALRSGVQLPAEGADWFTWDPALRRSPNRPWRRWGSDRLVATVIAVVEEYRLAHPFAPRIGIGDLSRRRGGDFGRRFGGLGHASHQNGLDADVYYPRTDGLERRAPTPAHVDRAAAQELVDRFLAAGAKVVYVGPRLNLKGPRKRVVPLVHHDDHLHVRLTLR